MELSIDALVLDGFPAGTEQAVATAFRAELGRLLAQEHPSRGNTPHVLQTPRLTFNAGTAPDEMGRTIARAVHRSLLAHG